MKEFIPFGGFGDSWGMIQGYVGVLLESVVAASKNQIFKYSHNMFIKLSQDSLSPSFQRKENNVFVIYKSTKKTEKLS